MAAAGDGDIGEAEGAGAKAKSRRTIHDYLGEGEDGEAPYPETPPRLRLPRFTCARIRFGGIGRRKLGGSRGRKDAAEKSEEGASSSADSSAGAAAAAQTGMGLSMLLLLARTCVELNRMAEVRAQMEALLKEIRDEAGRVKGVAADHAAVAPKTCNSNLQSSSSSSSSCVSDTSTNCLEIGRGENGKRTSEEDDEACAGTDAQGAELEAEPALRQPPSPLWKCDSEHETPEVRLLVCTNSSTAVIGTFSFANWRSCVLRSVRCNPCRTTRSSSSWKEGASAAAVGEILTMTATTTTTDRHHRASGTREVCRRSSWSGGCTSSGTGGTVSGSRRWSLRCGARSGS
jgi:hypothetical protein